MKPEFGYPYIDRAVTEPPKLKTWARGEGIPIDEVRGDIFEARYATSVEDVASMPSLDVAIDRYFFLNDLFSSMPRKEKVDFISELDNFNNKPIEQAKVKEVVKFLSLSIVREKPDLQPRTVLRTIFDNSSTDELNRDFLKTGVDISILPELLDDPAMYSLLDVLLDNPDEHRFQIGALLTQLNHTKMPLELREELASAMSDNEFSLRLGNKEWFLCSDAEPRLLTSLRNRSYLLVNDDLLVKFKGKFSALCLDTFTTETNQTFLEGVWYSPVDDDTRQKIREAYDAGKGRLDLEDGEWAMMRSLIGTEQTAPDKILARARRIASRTPDTLPAMIGKSTRKEYRKDNEE